MLGVLKSNGKRHLFGKQLNDVKKLFKTIDRDRSGSLDKPEFEKACKRLGFGLRAGRVCGSASGLCERAL